MPWHCDLGERGENESLPLCSERIITVNRRSDGWGYFPKPSFIDKWMLYRLNVNYNAFRAVTTSFFLRLKSEVRSIVYLKVRDSWRSSLSDQGMNPLDTVSLPIRASDKCRQNGVGGEMECWTSSEYVAFLRTVSFLSKERINTVIITSESTEFVRNLSLQIASNLSKEWRVIVNREDVSSEIGASDYVQRREWRQDSDRRLATELKYDPIVGALSSMLLQLTGSKYMAITKSSNWLDLMWALNKHLHCESIFWFESIEKECFEFNQWGLANKRVYAKSISYPPDLWEEIKTNFKSDRQFQLRFGVRPKTYRPCRRYHMLPFERSDTLY